MAREAGTEGRLGGHVPELTARRSAVERELTAGTLPDAAKWRRQVTQMMELLREMRRGRTP
ncbi:MULTISPECIES: hypothetical protein [Streptomyces]|uniref:hypothetical protein n=1 Tax=Streptomyces TaxID=1883 RepID=UPI002DDA4624|nr:MULTISPECIES: hypothetical protein [unclassified Streptomyces]WSD98323.1 hypothetical protein OG758_31725 [Streptomyces sp. NBC_01474]